MGTRRRTAWENPGDAKAAHGGPLTSIPGQAPPLPTVCPPGGEGCSAPISSPHPRASLRAAPRCGSAGARQQAARCPPCLALPNSSGTGENKTPPAERFVGNSPAGFTQTPWSSQDTAGLLEGGQGHGARARWQSGCDPADTALPVPGRYVPRTLPAGASPADGTGAARGGGAGLKPRNVLVRTGCSPVGARGSPAGISPPRRPDEQLFHFGSRETTG